MKKIIMTGGGTAGHVNPNIALFPILKEHGYDISYIGSYNGIEKELIEEQGIDYHPISSGKLRRYMDVKNFTDPFRIVRGYRQALSLMKKLSPDVVFSKGGFVSVPVVFAAAKRKVPVIIHESDMTPGLANRLAIPKAARVCCNFPETLSHLPPEKAIFTGSPIRKELLDGNRQKGLALCGFDEDKPVLLVIGGSSGARHINDTIRKILPSLLPRFRVVHLCGAGMLDESLVVKKGYTQFEYSKNGLKHLFAAADIVVSRAGANAILEILALKKPNILIPLPLSASRGDQILNANSFKTQGFSRVLYEEECEDISESDILTPDTLLHEINEVYDQRNYYQNQMNNSKAPDAINTIFRIIEKASS